MNMLELVISGGQTGADQAGWRAAKAAGIPTGGFMPKGFLTEDGFRPEFAEMYGAKEHTSAGYPARTRANINWCDGIILFGDPRSRGSRLALSIMADLAFETPCLTIQHHERDRHDYAVNFLGQKAIRILNVAGNRESSAPGIGAWVEAYLTEVFRLLKEGS